MLKQLCLVEKFPTLLFREDLRRELVAGRPVIDERQKAFHFAHATVKVFYAGNDERVQLVFVKKLMRQNIDEIAVVVCFQQLFCICPELRCPDSDEVLTFFVRDQLSLKVGVFYILHLPEVSQDLRVLFSFHKRSSPYGLSAALRFSLFHRQHKYGSQNRHNYECCNPYSAIRHDALHESESDFMTGPRHD